MHTHVAVTRSRLREGALDAVSVISPRCCAGCGRPDRAICNECERALAPVVRRVDRAGLPAVAAFEFAGIAATVIVAMKEAGRTDVAPALAGALRMLVRAALRETPVLAELTVPSAPRQTPWPVPGGPGIELLVVPSSNASWRRRGYHPMEAVLAAAGLRSSRVLRRVASRRDQAGLSRAEREMNMAGCLAATRRLDGRRFLLVDDILTTGATAREVVRAVAAGGGCVLCVVVLATTRRRIPDPDQAMTSRARGATVEGHGVEEPSPDPGGFAALGRSSWKRTSPDATSTSRIDSVTT